MLQKARALVSSWFYSLGGFVGAYPSTDPRREIMQEHRPIAATADQALIANLPTLVAQCRQLDRATCAGRSVTEAWRADLVGTGIAIMPNTGDADLDAILADLYEECFAREACTNGRSLYEWQSVAIADLVASGEALARLVIIPDRIQRGLIPLAILPLEAEWLDHNNPVGPIPAGMRYIGGKIVDQFQRVRFYDLRNPEDLLSPGERVPAEQVIDLYEWRRAQQTRGEPILSPAIGRIWQDDNLVTTELKASVVTAAPAMVIETTDPNKWGKVPTDGSSTKAVTNITAGAVSRLRPGETLKVAENTRPSQQIAPFRQGIRGDIASACRASQYWLDRDAGRANYSSMRMDQLLTKRALALPKYAFGREIAGKVYEAALPWLLILAGRQMPADPLAAARMRRYELRPDQPEYVDPEKDIQASVEAINNDLSSYDLECSSRNKDYRQLFKQRKTEQAERDRLAVERIVELQTMIAKANAADPELKLHWSHIATLSGSASAPGAYLAAAAPAADPTDPTDQTDQADHENDEVENETTA